MVAYTVQLCSYGTSNCDDRFTGYSNTCEQHRRVACGRNDLSNGAFGTHSATRIFVPPSRQNRSIRNPTGWNQWASGRMVCSPSSPVHATFTFKAKTKRARRDVFNVLTRGLRIYLHCYFVYRKIDANPIIIRQLKTVSPRAFGFSGVFSARLTRHNGNYVTVSMFLIRNKFV